MENRNIVCRWCGYEGKESEFDLDPVRDGFWCPDCDNYTFFDEKENEKRRFIVMLESNNGHGRDGLTHIPCNNDPEYVLDQSRLDAKKVPAVHISPLRYPGGKSRIAKYILQQLDQRNMETFVECFAGGASIGLLLLSVGYTRHLVLNDKDPAIAAFWREATEHADRLVQHLEQPVSRNAVMEAREIIAHPDGVTQETLAWSELLANRTGYSGITIGGLTGGAKGTDKQMFSRYNPKALIQRIRHIESLADKIEVLNKDACELIEESVYWDEHATLFIDPPYVRVGQKLYKHAYKEEDHARLAELLQQLVMGFPSANIVITYDDCELIRNLYQGAEIVEIGRNYSLRNKNM